MNTTDAPIPVGYFNSNWRITHREIPRDERYFVVWDGEGSTVKSGQNYTLLGNFDGRSHSFIERQNLSTAECLTFLVQEARKHPKAWHVAFAFDYDVNMILRDLSPESLQRLRETNITWYGKFRIEHIPGKWFRVTYKPSWENDAGKVTLTIADTFGFYQTSLLKALKGNIPNHPLMANLETVAKGKALRGAFTWDDREIVRRYWEIENQLFHALTVHLKDMLYDERVGLKIASWHGPGALANYTYRRMHIKDHKSETPTEVYDKARYAYAGGRFELFRAGRHEHVYSYDINSAYPAAIAQLPSMSEGQWHHETGPFTTIYSFAMYHVRLRGIPFDKRPGPFFHRDSAGNISYPWITDGWYWGPEVLAAIQAGTLTANDLSISEAWIYRGAQTQPFAFVSDMYTHRRMLKAQGDGAQMALKLCLNSLYGKMAQRAGWERTKSAPTWHQLEWAGWVTSYTRAKLYSLISMIPWEQLIAVETDGIYTTAAPESLGLVNSSLLGEWEIDYYDEIIYLQSGIYSKRQGDQWSSKYRGLDAKSISVEQIVEHAKLLKSNESWPALRGTTTRFVGYRQALFRESQNRGSMKLHHCKWETEPKEISVGSIGKRQHEPRQCTTCLTGENAYTSPHDLIIASRSLRDPISHRHDIPWLEMPQYEYRMREELIVS